MAPAAGAWRWTHGRLAGLQFASGGACSSHFMYVGPSQGYQLFQHCPFGGWGPPTVTSERCAELRPAASGGVLKGADCAAVLPCAACERSPCRLGPDCVPNATNKMTGDYYPNCFCECKQGYTGLRCEITIVDQGPYVSEYTLQCGAAMDNSNAQAACVASGVGFDLATFPTRAAYEAFTFQFIPSQFDGTIATRVWAAGTDLGKAGTWVWNAGRLSGRQFSQGPTCLPIPYWPVGSHHKSFTECSWTAFEPSPNEDCVDFYGHYATAINNEGCEWELYCHACERSPCQIGPDCNFNTTRAVVGDYFPNCRCECKEGYAGPRCEITLVEHGLYASEYTLLCGEGASDHSFAGASVRCAALGPGWARATFPTEGGLVVVRRPTQ